MQKPGIIIYINNTIAILIFFLIKTFLKNRNYNKSDKKLLFINSGQIGDLVVSSILLDYDNVFNGYEKVYFLIKEEYKKLFEDYIGKINIITYNYKKYKWNLSYKIKTLKYLQSLQLTQTYNLSAARGVLNDEMTLMSGAKEFYCMSSSWTYLKKAFGKYLDSCHSEVLFKGVKNEYEKHKNLLSLISKNNNSNYDVANIKTFRIDNPVFKNEYKYFFNSDYICIAPLASDIKRSWGIEKYRELCNILSKKFKVILFGTEEEKTFF